MACSSISRLVPATCVGVCAIGAFLAQPQVSQACSPDPCQWSSRFAYVDLRTQTVGEGGVLVFEGSQGPDYGIEQSMLGAINLRASVGDTQIPGQLELIDGFAGFIWRPDTPLSAGSQLDVQLTIDNAAIDSEQCGEEMITLTGSVDVDFSASATPSTPSVTTQPSVEIVPSRQLDTLVCCDGAYPVEEPLCGTYSEVYWGTEGECFAFEGTGTITVEIDLDVNAGAPSPVEEDDTLRRLVKNGEPLAMTMGNRSFALSDTEPFCFTVEAISASSGEVVQTQEQCFGDDMLDSLGPQRIDVEADLARCEGDAYVCEPIDHDFGGQAWDEDNCTPWDDVEPTTGTESASGSDSSSGSDSGSGSGSGSGPGPGSGSGPGSDSDSDTDAEDTTGLTDRGDGCACSTSSDSPSSGWMWLGLGLLGLRRRRQSSLAE